MSLQAVGWLSKSLGLNVAGRAPEEDGGGMEKTETTNQDGVDDLFGAPKPTATQRLGRLVGTMGQYVFGASSEEPTAAAPAKPKHEDDTVDFDENGLPRTRNWYVYDDASQCWVVTDDAPENVKREYELKKKAIEEERLGLKKAVAPPPPPPVGGIMGGQNRAMPTNQYAAQDYFGTASVPPPAIGSPYQAAPSFPMPPSGSGFPPAPPAYVQPTSPLPPSEDRPALEIPSHTSAPSLPPHVEAPPPQAGAPPPLPTGLPFPQRVPSGPPGLPQLPTFPMAKPTSS